MNLRNRFSYNSTSYPTTYSFNGMEKDDEVKGNGNSYTTEFRQLDPRVGRWLSLDPKFKSFPWQSPYVAFDNIPSILRDPNGLATEGGTEGGWKKGAKGSRKKENGNGTTTYDAPKGNVILPERAKIIETLQDGNGNKKVDYNGKSLEGEFGDVYKFNLDGEEYVANYKSGKFNGYVNKAGEMYSFSGNKSKGNSPKSNFSNQLSFRGWDDQNPPFESAGIFGELNLNTPWEGNSISASADNTQEGTIETSVIQSRQTDIFGIPKVGVSGGAGFDFKTREGHIEADAYRQFEISTSIGYLGISFYSNSKGEKGFKLNPSFGLDLFPFSITNSTILDEKK